MDRDARRVDAGLMAEYVVADDRLRGADGQAAELLGPAFENIKPRIVVVGIRSSCTDQIANGGLSIRMRIVINLKRHHIPLEVW